ncbi:hypothetical protein Rsub_03978 [Raphidocelis subcapitata]|uniref:IST1-like protein n=1 Tax=Raphidocelis subcapitata TaxID=307507 RepID=A0A2V0NVK5_9CHLO|nr:hypothetical protein Rsub_03978 [Raphidocelis subcapitata]|eukprot:GBF91674.1 hypothetical protein Rsub_03978 [Raphidocelis subcapitata]
MLGGRFDPAKCETTCRMALGRIKIVRNKRNVAMAQHRREIADLLRQGKQDYARIRVESVLRETATLQAFELLELYLELLAVRAPLVATSKEIPRDMVEALSSVLYAASRVPDLPELTSLHKMFAQKYGKEYVEQASSDVNCHRWNVNESLRRYVAIEPPEPAVKLQTLSDIAQQFGVEWDLERASRELLGPAEAAAAAAAAAAATAAAASAAAAPPPAAAPAPAPAPAYGGAPTGPPPPFASAQQAAAAAAAAAADAQRAAEYARHLAGGGGGGGGGYGAPPAGAWAPAGAPPPPAGGGGGGGYRVPSQEEIQRAYDSAQGPPAKGYLDPAPPPAAAPPSAPPPAPGAAGAPQSGGGGGELPEAPKPGGPAGAGGSGGGGDLDDLHARLQALKKQ